MAQSKIGSGTKETRAPARILAGFGSIADELQTINAALALADALRAEISGFFVEESNLLDFAALPFAKAFRPNDNSSKPIELQQMEQQIADAAAAWKRRLGAGADRSRITWTFSTARGDYCTEIASAAVATDIVVINPANVTEPGRNAVSAVLGVLKQAAGMVLLPDNAFATRRGPVILLARDAVPNRQTLRLADRIASSTDSELVVLVATHSIFDETRSVALEIVENNISIRRMHGADLSAAGNFRPSFVIWPDSEQTLSGNETEYLLRTANAPLLLLRSSHVPGSDDDR